MDYLVVIAVPVLLAAVLAGPGRRLSPVGQGWLQAIVFAVCFSVLLTRLDGVADGGAEQLSVTWVPALGLSASLYIDGLALLFGLVVTGIAAIADAIHLPQRQEAQ